MDRVLKQAVASMATVTNTAEGVRLELRHPEQPELPPSEFMFASSFSGPLFALPYSSELRQIVSVYSPMRSVNRHHPLVKLALDSRILEAPSDLQEFVGSLVWLASDTKTLDWLRNPQPTIGRWRKQIGWLYRNIDWQSVAEDLHPPYLILDVNGEIVELGANDFERWANAQLDEKE